MRKYVWLPLILMAVFGSAAVQSKAQSATGVRANVPFDFIVGDRTIQAGRITARGVNASDSGALAIANGGSGQQALRIAQRMTGTDASNTAKLVFHRYGNRYYLAQVWVPGYKAWEVLKSKSEKALERETGVAMNSKLQTVIVAADLL